MNGSCDAAAVCRTVLRLPSHLHTWDRHSQIVKGALVCCAVDPSENAILLLFFFSDSYVP